MRSDFALRSAKGQGIEDSKAKSCKKRAKQGSFVGSVFFVYLDLFFLWIESNVEPNTSITNYEASVLIVRRAHETKYRAREERRGHRRPLPGSTDKCTEGPHGCHWVSASVERS